MGTRPMGMGTLLESRRIGSSGLVELVRALQGESRFNRIRRLPHKAGRNLHRGGGAERTQDVRDACFAVGYGRGHALPSVLCCECTLFLLVYGVWLWRMLMVENYGVRLWCMFLLVYGACGVWCVLMTYGYGGKLWCTVMVHVLAGVWCMWCMVCGVWCVYLPLLPRQMRSWLPPKR